MFKLMCVKENDKKNMLKNFLSWTNEGNGFGTYHICLLGRQPAMVQSSLLSYGD